jgi:hypothetical protein
MAIAYIWYKNNSKTIQAYLWHKRGQPSDKFTLKPIDNGNKYYCEHLLIDFEKSKVYLKYQGRLLEAQLKNPTHDWEGLKHQAHFDLEAIDHWGDLL